MYVISFNESSLNILGIPIRTEVVLYPTPADSGLFVNILRTLVEMHWWLIVALMTTVDALGACSLVFVGHKFRYGKKALNTINGSPFLFNYHLLPDLGKLF